MEREELIKARAYFEKAKGIRMGLWMSELRRQYAIRMSKQGAESKHIKAVTFLRHDQIWHYLNRCKPNPSIEKVVIEEMDKWIDNGLYPVSKRVMNGKVHIRTDYELSEDPKYRIRKITNINNPSKGTWDKLVDDLLI